MNNGQYDNHSLFSALNLKLFLLLQSFSSFSDAEAVLNNTHSVVHIMLGQFQKHHMSPGVGVPGEKNLGGNRVLPKFSDVCPNLDFLELYRYEKKIYQKFTVKSKKKRPSL